MALFGKIWHPGFSANKNQFDIFCPLIKSFFFCEKSKRLFLKLSRPWSGKILKKFVVGRYLLHYLHSSWKNLFERILISDPLRFDSEKMARQMTGFIDGDMELECIVIGGPYYTIKWGKGNKTLSPSSSSQVRSSGERDEVRFFRFFFDPKTRQPTKLILNGLQYFDRAEYFCNATSFDGNEISASFMLRVKCE